MPFPASNSRSTDPNDRSRKAFGFGTKTSRPDNWRWWSEGGSKGFWRISAPYGLADYRLVGCQLYLNGEFILEGQTQWDATWRALGHFYTVVVPQTEPPPLG
jgi:hypothetical protein